MRWIAFALALGGSLFSAPVVLAAGPCHTRCGDYYKACKSGCKGGSAFYEKGRYECVNRCKSRLHTCNAGC
jgi:hypothetical protein